MKRRGLPEYCSEFQDRHGKWRVRFRRNGKTTYFKARPGTDEFAEEYRRLLAAEPEIGAAWTESGTLNALIVEFYKKGEFKTGGFNTLAPLTKSTYRNILERLRTEHGAKRVKMIEREHVKAMMRKREATPSAANHFLDLFRVLMAFAIEKGWRADDPTAGVKRLKESGAGFHPWADEEIAQYKARHPVGTKARLALALLEFTAVRRSDVVLLGPQHYRPRGPGDDFDWLAPDFMQEKTDKPVHIPVHPELAKIIAATSTVGLRTYLVTDYGQPITAKGFGNWFRKRCDEAGLPHCSAHGVRKHRMATAANVGATTSELKAVGGHKTLREVERYTASANEKRLATSAMRKMIEAGK